MGLLFPDDDEHQFTYGRAIGFARYKEVLERSFKEFFLVGFIALAAMIPFALGMVYAVLSSSSLVVLAAAVVGGAISGPAMACMYDIILRRLRDDQGDWWTCWKKSMGQNWRASLLPGVVQCLFLGMVIFSGALQWWSQRPASLSTLVLLAVSVLAATMVLSVWWPQVVLFEQTPLLQLKNSLFFILFHPGRVLGAAAVQVVWWLVLFLFLPWSAFVVPFLGVWYILYLALFILYRPLDEAFRIEEQIWERFPEKRPGDGEE